jgi:hypothetical protein
MNKEELLKRTAILKEEIAKIEQELSKAEKKERWRAPNNKEHYYIKHHNEVICDKDAYGIVDNKLFEAFNYFKTKEEAERIARVQLAYRKLDWAIRQFEVVGEFKAGVVFVYDKTVGLTWGTESNMRSPLPKLRTDTGDAEYILQNYQSELMTFLTGGER